MSGLQTSTFAETAPRSSPNFTPEDVAGVLEQVEHFRCLISQLLMDNRAGETSVDVPPEVPHQLRLIAERALDYSITLSDDKLQTACDNAVAKLQSVFPFITSEHDWNDAWQETWRALRMKMWNLAGNPIDSLDNYAFQTMQSLIRRWRKKGGRKKPLSVIPGGEESITVRENHSDQKGVFDREAFCLYLDAQHQPNPDLPMSKVFQAFDDVCSTRAKVAAKLGVSITEVDKQLKAIRAYRKLWEG